MIGDDVDYVRKAMSAAAESLLNPNNLPCRQIKERVFVEKYLPQFINTIPEDSKFKLDLRDWVDNVSGRATMPVDVIDESGRILYRVPPVLGIEAEARQSINGQPTSLVMEKVRLMNQQVRGHGDAYLKEQLDADGNIDSVNTDNWLALQAIIQRYIKPEEKTNTDASAENSGFDDDFDVV